MGSDFGASTGTASSWPPPGTELSTQPGLPGPGYVVARVTRRQTLLVILLPLVLFASFGRLFVSGLPVSRVLNPAVLGMMATVELFVVVVGLRRRGRPTVVGTHDWVAGRSMFGRRWRQQHFATVTRFSTFAKSGRGTAPTVVTIGGPAETSLQLSLNNDDPALPALLARLRSAGAVEVGRRELSPVRRGQVWGILAAVFAGIGLPMAYLMIGPLRLLPPSVVGAFTSSGCRASLAVEGRTPEIATPIYSIPLWAGGEQWAQVETREETASSYAAHTTDPTDRVAHLERDGFTGAFETYLRNGAGAVVEVAILRFSSPSGAQSYDTYVNRAVCENFSGAAGPRPTEVLLHDGKVTVIRWVAGDSVVEVSPTRSTPFATGGDIEAVATALGDQLTDPRTASSRATG